MVEILKERFSDFEAKDLVARAMKISEIAKGKESDVFLYLWTSPSGNTRKVYNFLGLKKGEVKENLISLFNKLKRPEKIALIIFVEVAIEEGWIETGFVIEEMREFLDEVIPEVSI